MRTSRFAITLRQAESGGGEPETEADSGRSLAGQDHLAGGAA